MAKGYDIVHWIFYYFMNLQYELLIHPVNYGMVYIYTNFLII